MAANLDVVKAAAIAVFAVICTVVYITANVSVSFHNKNLLFVLLLFLPQKLCLFRKSSNSKIFFIKIQQH